MSNNVRLILYGIINLIFSFIRLWFRSLKPFWMFFVYVSQILYNRIKSPESKPSISRFRFQLRDIHTAMNSDKIAVDVVLIPPEEILRLAIDTNKTFPESVTENYVLDLQTCIPHLTLLMGLISKRQLPEVGRRLALLAEKFSTLDLKITGIKTSAQPNGKILSGLEIEKSKELQKFHEAIVAEMSSVFTYDTVQKEMFYTPPAVQDTPMFWVKGFAKNNIKEKYSPHITLGVGSPKQKVVLPISFKASKLALCHLGNYCTCRKILWSTTLN